MSQIQNFDDLSTLAQHFRDELQRKKYVLLYAYNGTGKTRLSAAFKDLGRRTSEDGESIVRDTLYFNAFTEDLFTWDNDLERDETRVLRLNTDSSFFAGLGDLEMETRVRSLLNRYADFDFQIDTQDWQVSFARDVPTGDGDRHQKIGGIKISRGEENIFIWCFFLAIVEVTLDQDMEAYDWVKYIYIDDPISSLDEQNAVMVATHLAKILKDAHQTATTTAQETDPPGLVISTHHPLFHNVLWNELKKGSRRYFLDRKDSTGGYTIRNTESIPFFHHLAALVSLYDRDLNGDIDTYHFNTLRAIAEKTASFLGYANFGDCIKREADDLDGVLHTRLLNLLSHGGWSVYEPTAMGDDNREKFRRMLHRFIREHAFNLKHFPGLESVPAEAEETHNP